MAVSYKGLSEFLYSENPYGGELEALVAPPGDGSRVPSVVVDRTVRWTFGGVELNVCKAMRIPYTVLDDDGSRVVRHMLVGIEGDKG